MSLKKWVSTEDAVELLCIGRSRLMDLKSSGELKVGTHWVYSTGKRSGPIGWCIEKINQWQIDQSLQIVKAPQKAADAIDSYELMEV